MPCDYGTYQSKYPLFHLYIYCSAKSSASPFRNEFAYCFTVVLYSRRATRQRRSLSARRSDDKLYLFLHLATILSTMQRANLSSRSFSKLNLERELKPHCVSTSDKPRHEVGKESSERDPPLTPLRACTPAPTKLVRLCTRRCYRSRTSKGLRAARATLTRLAARCLHRNAAVTACTSLSCHPSLR
jgi:hypothetical protein